MQICMLCWREHFEEAYFSARTPLQHLLTHSQVPSSIRIFPHLYFFYCTYVRHLLPLLGVSIVICFIYQRLYRYSPLVSSLKQ